jgi:hypothetical protein
MTYHSGKPSRRPEVGGYYELRAGLSALITEKGVICGVVIWRGMIFADGQEPNETFWWTEGHYCTDRGMQHELDIIHETAY